MPHTALPMYFYQQRFCIAMDVSQLCNEVKYILYILYIIYIYIIYLYSPFIDDHFIIDRSYTLVLTFVNRYEVSNLCTHTHRMQPKFEILFFFVSLHAGPKA